MQANLHREPAPNETRGVAAVEPDHPTVRFRGQLQQTNVPMAERLAVLNAKRHRAEQEFGSAQLDGGAPFGKNTFENVSGHRQGYGATMELLRYQRQREDGREKRRARGRG